MAQPQTGDIAIACLVAQLSAHKRTWTCDEVSLHLQSQGSRPTWHIQTRWTPLEMMSYTNLKEEAVLSCARISLLCHWMKDATGEVHKLQCETQKRSFTFITGSTNLDKPLDVYSNLLLWNWKQSKDCWVIVQAVLTDWCRQCLSILGLLSCSLSSETGQ